MTCLLVLPMDYYPFHQVVSCVICQMFPMDYFLFHQVGKFVLSDVFSSDGFNPLSPQWGAADAEIKVPSGENTELKRSPFKACSRSVYSHAFYAYCQGFLPYIFLPSGPFTCIFSKPPLISFLFWLWLTPVPV